MNCSWLAGAFMADSCPEFAYAYNSRDYCLVGECAGKSLPSSRV